MILLLFRSTLKNEKNKLKGLHFSYMAFLANSNINSCLAYVEILKIKERYRNDTKNQNRLSWKDTQKLEDALITVNK